MTAPSGGVIARVFVDVIPDVRNFAKQLRQDLRSSSRELRALDREIAPVQRSLAFLARTSTGITPGIQLATRSFLLLGGHAVIGGIVALGGALQVASGAVAVLPAAGALAASVMGTLAIGMRGVGDALKDFDDADDEIGRASCRERVSCCV